jgi:hypothetical protein
LGPVTLMCRARGNETGAWPITTEFAAIPTAANKRNPKKVSEAAGSMTGSREGWQPASIEEASGSWFRFKAPDYNIFELDTWVLVECKQLS